MITTTDGGQSTWQTTLLWPIKYYFSRLIRQTNKSVTPALKNGSADVRFGIQTTPQNFERRIVMASLGTCLAPFWNSVNERQKIWGANPEQKQTQTFRCHVAEDQILAVDKEKEIDKFCKIKTVFFIWIVKTSWSYWGLGNRSYFDCEMTWPPEFQSLSRPCSEYRWLRVLFM